MRGGGTGSERGGQVKREARRGAHLAPVTWPEVTAASCFAASLMRRPDAAAGMAAAAAAPSGPAPPEEEAGDASPGGLSADRAGVGAPLGGGGGGCVGLGAGPAWEFTREKDEAPCGGG